jgi:phytoene dehydrogenase-like protein
VDLAALGISAFDPGAVISIAGRRAVVSDPFRDPAAAPAAALNTMVPLADKLRVLWLVWRLRSTEPDDEPDESTLDYLVRSGFSVTMIDRFFRPFYGGIFLDRSLSTSARRFRAIFRALVAGRAVLPAQGIGQLSEQLAAPLAARDAVMLGCAAVGLLDDAGVVAGARLADGRLLRADATVLAVDAPAAARLAGIAAPPAAWSATTVLLAGPRRAYAGRKIVLNAAHDPLVNSVQQLTNVVPGYAPAGQHLLSVALAGTPPSDDAVLEQAVRAELRHIFAGDRAALEALAGMRLLEIMRIPFAQFRQPPGGAAQLPGNRSGRAGLYLAGEYTTHSSIEGAMLSGERAALAVLADLRGHDPDQNRLSPDAT